MFCSKALRQGLSTTTALFGIALLSSQIPARAASFDFTTPGHPTQTLNTGETGVVESGGGITAAGYGVFVSGV